MKFEEKLRLELVPEWREHYINYDHLKRLIYELERWEYEQRAGLTHGYTSTGSATTPYRFGRSFGASSPEDEGAPLLRGSVLGSDERMATVFLEFLQKELDRVCDFFDEKRGQVMQEVKEVCAAPAKTARDVVEQLYKRTVELTRYATLNADGFRKGIKKHNKTCRASTVPDAFYVSVRHQLLNPRAELDSAAQELAQIYAQRFCGGDQGRADQLLAALLREQVRFERETVWRELVAETHGAVAMEKPPSSLWGRYRQAILLTLAGSVLIGISNSDLFGTDPADGAKRDCFALLCAASVLWCSEAVPLFVTAICIPFFICIMRILIDPNSGERLPAAQASKQVFAGMFDNSISLALGGFTLAAALSKHLIARRCADAVLSAVGSSPPGMVLAVMGISLVSSAFITNVAAPALCCSLIAPLLRMLPSDSGLARALVAGVAVSGNIGGMLSPISSMQNIFGVTYMTPPGGSPPSWLSWFAVSVPICTICTLVGWRLLLYIYRIDAVAATELRQLHAADVPMSPMRIFVTVVSIATVALWCLDKWVEAELGGLGVTSLMPLMMFFGSGALDKANFEQLPWSVVMLAMGGKALGAAVANCGLLGLAATAIFSSLGSLSLWALMGLFTAVAGVLVCFVSHTVGAMVLLPLVQNVGDRLNGGEYSRMLVMGTTLMCSGGMALPVSSFPNMIAVAQQDQLGRPYIAAADFLTVGTMGTLLSWLVVNSLGYVLLGLTF
eukprot:TRINITY_DN9715_c0_g1_i1.p1 TRINITY_DN9715_c0_g1~~TRINITY_DN9715_c0_g1_i1.p1  ORF type:complete len:730 (+),score=208.62 TRINITY_DN9715_c0_g1_i1:88-2277(+)